jgi:hypothetical protein
VLCYFHRNSHDDIIGYSQEKGVSFDIVSRTDSIGVEDNQSE